MNNNFIKVNIFNLNPLFDWVASHPKKGDESLSRRELLEKFQKSCDLPDPSKNTLKRYSNLSDYLSPSYIFFSSQFNDAISIVSAFNPNNTRFKELKNEFYKNIANVRYFPETSAPILKEITQEVVKELFEIEQISPKYEKIKNLKYIFDEFLQNTNLFDVPMAILVGECDINRPVFNSTLFNLFKSCNQFAESVVENSNHIVMAVEKKLQKFLTDPNPDFKQAAENILKLFSCFQKRYFPKILKLQSKSFFDFHREKMNDLVELGKVLARLLGHLGSDVDVPKDDVYFGGDQNVCFTHNDKSIPKLISLRTSLKGKLSDEKLNELDKRIEFLEALASCYVLLDGLIEKPIDTYALSARQIFHHCKLLDKSQIQSLNKLFFKKLKIKTEIDDQEKEKSVCSEEDLSIDERVELIGTSSKKTKKKKTTSRKHSQTKQETVQASRQNRTKPTNSKPPSSKSTVINPQEIQALDKQEVQVVDKIDYREFRELSSVLGQLSISYQDPMIKGCLRQSQMYLDDLIIAHKKLAESHHSETTRRFYAMTLIQATYFCLEAMLQFNVRVMQPDEEIIEGSGHNLKKLAIKAAITEKDQLISELFLANYWVRTPYEQHKIWGNFTVPQLLSDIKKVYEEKKVGPILNNISSYLTRTKTFIQTLPVIAESVEKITPAPQPNIMTYKLPTTNQLNEFRELNKKCENLLSKIPSYLSPKFSQVLAHLKLIEGIFEELEKGEISSDLFSLLVRNLIFWENSFLEGVLQVVYGMKSGRDSRSHNLSKIHQNIAWEVKEKSDSSFLSRNLVNVHNISRYPFSSENTLSPLHALILKGELLREHSELGEENPYKLQAKKKNKGQTKINYLQVSSKEMGPENIINELYQVTDKILHYVNEMVLPELEQSL